MICFELRIPVRKADIIRIPTRPFFRGVMTSLLKDISNLDFSNPDFSTMKFSMVQKFMVETSGVEKFMVEKSGFERSGV